MVSELKENPCKNCLVKATCIEQCQNLTYFGNYIRRKNNGNSLGLARWISEHEVRSRIISRHTKGFYIDE